MAFNLFGKGKAAPSDTAEFQDSVERMRKCYLQYLKERRALILAGGVLPATEETVGAAGDLGGDEEW